jgi:integrase
LRRRAGVLRVNSRIRQQPRLHDLRHAHAVHRLVSWYRTGADVQRLLPQLSTYLGHGSVVATQRYLTLTVELLEEASARFERYAMGA